MKALSGFYYVDGGDGALTACRGRGKFRHQKLTPLVGDRVRFTPLGEGAGILDEILPRKNQFQRPAVANIDQLVVIASGAVPVLKFVFLYFIKREAKFISRRGKNSPWVKLYQRARRLDYAPSVRVEVISL